MAETIYLGEIAIAVTRKNIKHVHLSVYPPSGRVTLVHRRPAEIKQLLCAAKKCGQPGPLSNVGRWLE